MNQQNTGSADSAETSLGGLGAKSHEAAEQLKHTVVDQVEQVRHRAESAKGETADRIRRVAQQLQTVSETLRPDDSLAASVAERASNGVEGIAQYVSTIDARGLARDAEQLARRQPALFFGGAFLLGLAAGRFLKSSGGGEASQSRLDSSQPAPRPQPPSPVKEPARAGNDEQPPRVPGGARFKANYDATFGRDSDFEVGAGSTTGAGVAFPSPSATNGPDQNGYGDPRKGIAP